jgi:hypothetical protein
LPDNYNLPILNTVAFDSSVNEVMGKTQSIFNPTMQAYPVPMGSESKTWNLGGESEDAIAQTSRFGDTLYQDIAFQKRSFNRATWKVKAIPIDKNEVKSINFTPESHYVKAMARKLNKKRNDVFLDKFEEDVIVTNVLGDDGSTANSTVTFASGNIIAPTFGNSGTNIGLTVGKLDELLRLAEVNDLIGDEFEQEYGYNLKMIVPESQANLLYANSRTSSKDYSHFFKFDETRGKITGYRSISFVSFSSGIKTYTSTDTILKLYAWHPEAFIYDPERVTNYATSNIETKEYNSQVYSEMDYNVLRVREECAFRVDCKA